MRKRVGNRETSAQPSSGSGSGSGSSGGGNSGSGGSDGSGGQNTSNAQGSGESSAKGSRKKRIVDETVDTSEIVEVWKEITSQDTVWGVGKVDLSSCVVGPRPPPITNPRPISAGVSHVTNITMTTSPGTTLTTSLRSTSPQKLTGVGSNVFAGSHPLMSSSLPTTTTTTTATSLSSPFSPSLSEWQHMFPLTQIYPLVNRLHYNVSSLRLPITSGLCLPLRTGAWDALAQRRILLDSGSAIITKDDIKHSSSSSGQLAMRMHYGQPMLSGPGNTAMGVTSVMQDEMAIVGYLSLQAMFNVSIPE